MCVSVLYNKLFHLDVLICRTVSGATVFLS